VKPDQESEVKQNQEIASSSLLSLLPLSGVGFFVPIGTQGFQHGIASHSELLRDLESSLLTQEDKKSPAENEEIPEVKQTQENFASSSSSSSTGMLCSRCGRTSHNVSSCYARTHVSGRILTSAAPTSAHNNYYSDDCCFRCGRRGHWASDCYARSYNDYDYW